MDPGHVVAERFELEVAAGSGGMGEVFRAHDRQSDATVAIKLFTAADRESIARFLREAEVLAELRHQGIVRYVAHGQDGSTSYLAMEWVEGVDLAERLSSQRLQLHESLLIAKQVAEALAPAHARGMVHRDIKPENIRLRDGRIDRVKLLDFGLAHLAARSFTKTGAVLGTPHYMAPEQVAGDHDISGRTDVFALGCVLYECVTGQPPFNGESLVAVMAKILLERVASASELREGVPREVDELLARMLARDPAARPSDGAAAAEAIAEALAALRVPPPISSAPAATGSRPRGRAGLRSTVPPPLTDAEQRLVGVAMVRDEASDMGVTLRASELVAQRGLLAPAIDMGARCEVLADGTMVAVIAGARSASELFARAAACAFLLRDALDGVVALTIGRAVLSEHVPLGEALDRAAGLLERHPDRSDGVVVDHDTAALMRDQFAIVMNGSALTLLHARTGPDARYNLLGKPSPFIGRSRELQRLRAAFDASAEERSANATLVVGPPGAGKSRLRAELVAALQADNVPFECWIARGDVLGAGSSFGMLVQLVKRAAGIRESDPAAEQRQKLARRLAGAIDDEAAAHAREFLAELIGAPIEDAEAGQALLAARRSAALMGDHLKRAWLSLAHAACRQTTLMLVLEDMHWGDRSTAGFIGAALASELPLYVLALARPEVHDAFGSMWSQHGLDELRLRPLRTRSAEQLVRHALGDDADADVVARVVEQSEGNPLYLEELTRAAARGHKELPATVLAMLHARLEDLDPELRRVMRAASTYGRTFWASSLTALVGLSDADVAAALETLEQLELVLSRSDARFSGEQEYIFRHALLRDAAYAMFTEQDRRRAHCHAGEWLERQGERDATILAQHFESGGERERAAQGYARASLQALQGTDVESAVTSADRAIRCGASGETLGLLKNVQAEAHYWLNDLEQAEECASAAMACIEPGRAGWYDAAAELATIRARRGDPIGLDTLCSELDAIAPPRLSGAPLVAWLKICCALFLVGAYDAHERMLSRVIARRAAPDDGESLATAWLDRARSLSAVSSGDDAGYLRLVTSSREHFERVGDLRNGYLQWSNMGFGLLKLGAFERARDTLEEALSVSDKSGMHTIASWCRQGLGLAIAQLGDPRHGLELAAASADGFRRSGDRRLEARSRCYLCDIWTLAGDLDEALAQARRAVDASEGLLPAHASALGRLAATQVARVAQKGGDRQAAAEALEASDMAYALMSELGGLEEGADLVRLSYADALEMAGRRGEALQVISDAFREMDGRVGAIVDADLRASATRALARRKQSSHFARLLVESGGTP